MVPSSPPPPPPLPPPRSEDQTDRSPTHNERQKRLISEIIFPPYIPNKCHADVGAMVRLLRDLNATSATVGRSINGKGVGVSNGDDNFGTPFGPDEWRRMDNPSAPTGGPRVPSALAEAREINRVCRVYRTKAEVERRKVLGARRNQEISGNTMDNSDEGAIQEAMARSRIHEMNYRHCIARETCPERTARLVACWKFVGPEAMSQASALDRDGLVCRNEREALVRCSGRLAQRLVRLAIGD